ncbi:hypothetical protein GCM10027589_30260 [Actinocorallia lasiicapitis]
MTTWKGGTRAVYQAMTEGFADRIELGCAVTEVRRDTHGVRVTDATGRKRRYDQVIFACGADEALALLPDASLAERMLLGAVRYDDAIHGEAVVHTDRSVVPDTACLAERSTYVDRRTSGGYEITYLMHNQQPWTADRHRPWLVTYQGAGSREFDGVVRRERFHHVRSDLFHTLVLTNLFPLLQGRRRTWFCGAHTTFNSQEHCFLSGLAVAHRLGADYPFPEDREARAWFRFYGRLSQGPGFLRRAAAARSARRSATEKKGISHP